MTEHKNIDLNTKRKQYSDILELGIVFAFLFLIICIYVPRAIWDEEELFDMSYVINLIRKYEEE